MRLRLKVILGSILGFGATLFVIYWELVAANVDGLWIATQEPTVYRLSTNYPTDYQQRAKGHKKTADENPTGSFQRLHQDTYIYSAFVDNKERVIRLIVLSGKHYQPKMVCHYCDDGDDGKTCQCPSQSANYYTNNENHGRQYGGFIVSCQLPKCFDSYFIHVSVEGDTRRLRIPLISTPTATIKHEYSICIPPLRGEGTDFLYQLTEFIEVSLSLGASHLTFYDYQLDEPVKRLLTYYQQKGVVSLLLWDLPSHVTSNVMQLWYHGQVLAIQDCLYRNKATSQFVAFNDIDEFIIPLKHSTVPLFLREIHTAQHCGYCFDTIIFSLNARIPGARKNKRSKLRTLRVQHRTSKTLRSWSKCIVDPQLVFEMGIHHISKSINEHLTAVLVSKNDSLVFHYRKCASAFGIGNVCGDLVADDSMKRYTAKLKKKVDKAINHIQTM